MLLYKDGNNSIRWQAGERLNHLFEQRCDQFNAENRADHAAILINDTTLTFRDLDNRANQVARYLLQQGICSGDRVGLLFDKSVYTYATLLAALKINVAFVPLDAGFPQERIEFIVQDAEVKAILTLSAFEEQLSDIDVPRILLDKADSTIQTQATARLSPTEIGPLDDQLCYIIYTSGTTGNPKGVCIEHASICNFVRVAAEEYGLTAEDRVYQGMTIAFDFSVEEIWVPLIAGATLVPGIGNQLVGSDLADFLRQNEVTGLCCVPTLLATIEEDLPKLRWLLVSGEACPHDLVLRWHRPGRTMLNAYGPTEATVTATLTELYPNKPVTIGQPLLTYTTVILDEHTDRALEKGELGELGIAGVGLAKGYLNRDDLTEKKFIPDFIGIPDNPSQRIYRTGDLCRINEDDEIEYLGRIDTQVKIRGYRIELTEIESVLLQLPQVAQAVVDTFESEPGVKELVAYYTLKENTADLDPGETSEALRNRLPSYMIPAYLEKLDVIPMLPSNKADRKKLPAPVGPRFTSGNAHYVPPQSELEQSIAEALSDVLKTDRVSIEADFFYDLGAHSLLMAQFCTQLRTLQQNVDVSMRDVYTHRTVAELASYLSLTTQNDAQETPTVPQDYRIPTNWEYYSCGALQLLYYLAYIVYSLIFFEGFVWVISTNYPFAIQYLEAVLFTLITFLILSTVPILAKWILIGKWKAETIPIWSLRYFRFWMVKQLIQSSPMALFKGYPIYNVYLRLLGAKIGKNVVIQSKFVPPCTDLISIGDNTILRKDSVLLSYKAQSNYLYTGSVTIGQNAFVGEAAILDIDTVMEDNTQLGHSSSLHAGQVIPQGKRFHGSPAQETTANYSPLEAERYTPLRRLLYSGYQLLTLFLIASPISILIFDYLLQYFNQNGRLLFLNLADFSSVSLVSTVKILFLSLGLFFGALAFGLLFIYIVPRMLNLFMQEGKVYPLFGFHYYISRAIARITNASFYNTIFGDSSYIVYFLQFIGYNLSKVVQTGSNFGVLQRHETPFLSNIGSGTMVSDGLSMINLQMSSHAFKLASVSIGNNNFLGNSIHYPAEGRTGENCLLGTKVMVPIDGPLRENVGLLGSPSFEIPRTVERDKLPSPYREEKNRKVRLHKKNIHNTMTMIFFLGAYWFYFFVALLFAQATYAFAGAYATSYVAGYLLIMACFTLVYFAFIEWSSLGFKKLRPQMITIYDDDFWKVERYWKLSTSILTGLYKGTPFRNIIYRLLGVKMGQKVFDDGCHITEKTLVEVGDYCNLNETTVLQGHSLEDGMFKSDHIRLGNGCTLDCAAFAHYGVNLGDNVVLGPDSFLMKGETIDSNSFWCGNPAKFHTRLDENEISVQQLPGQKEIDWATVLTDLIKQGDNEAITVLVKQENRDVSIVIDENALHASAKRPTSSAKSSRWIVGLLVLLLSISTANSFFTFRYFTERTSEPIVATPSINASMVKLPPFIAGITETIIASLGANQFEPQAATSQNVMAASVSHPLSIFQPPTVDVPEVTVPKTSGQPTIATYPAVVTNPPASMPSTVYAFSSTYLPNSLYKVASAAISIPGLAKPRVSSPPDMALNQVTPEETTNSFNTQVSAPTLLPTSMSLLTPTQTPSPTTQINKFAPAIEPSCTIDINYLEEIAGLNERLLSPGEIFTKSWNVRNQGTCAISTEYELVMAGESAISLVALGPIPHIGPQQTGRLNVAMQAPSTPGKYFTYLHLRAPDGAVFGALIVEINVGEIEGERS